MKERIIDKQLAIKLRKEGKSHNEIRAFIPNLSKGTLSNWLKYIELTPQQLTYLEKRIGSKLEKARFASAKTNRARRIERTQKIYDEAAEEINQYISEPLFVLGLALYWAEGSKRTGTVELINSDPLIIKIMIAWFEKFLKIPKQKLKFRLYTHKPYSNDNLEVFWASTLNVNINQFQKTIYKPTSYTIKKIPDYKGCLRIYAGSINLLRKVLSWQKLLVMKLKIK